MFDRAQIIESQIPKMALQTKEDLGLYSANKQQADRFYKIVKKTSRYPISIRGYLKRGRADVIEP
jgi:hypothetical protein